MLREVAPGAPAQLVAPVPQLEFGIIGAPPPTVYAPFAFLVGRHSLTQTPAGQWEGTLASVTQSGLRYSATSVLTASTKRIRGLTDPRHERSERAPGACPHRPGGANALRVSARPTPAAGVAAMADSFSSPSGEAFRGFGGRHDGIDQHGQEFVNWLEQENVSSGSAQGLAAPASPGGSHYMFPNGPSAAYYVQSSFQSSAGYGFLLDRSELSRWRLDSDRSDAWQAEVLAPGIDYVVAPAAPAAAITQLTALSGRQPLPPGWALGSQFDREVRLGESAGAYAADIQGDLANFDRYHLHVDSYRIEGWQFLPRPTLVRDIAALRARHIHPLLYFRAFVGADSTGTDDPAQYDYAVRHGLVATHGDGTPYVFTSNFNANGAQIDFTNPAAVAWWQQRIRAALNLGADGFMQDFGEQVLADMHFHDGSTGDTMHNRLPIIYDRATRQVITAYERAHRGRQLYFFTRAGYSGTPGDAATENANFPGDETTDWTPASGLASQTPDMLNRGIGGAVGFGTDIGGYFDVGPYGPTTKELFLRWAEWAALSPIFRLHGSVLAGVHTPWSYDAETVRFYEAMVALHLRARPLITALWRRAEGTGMPIARPLWLADPGDRQAAAQDQEWMLGPDVLVAPVVVQGARAQSRLLPRRLLVAGRIRTAHHRGPDAQRDGAAHRVAVLRALRYPSVRRRGGAPPSSHAEQPPSVAAEEELAHLIIEPEALDALQRLGMTEHREVRSPQHLVPTPAAAQIVDERRRDTGAARRRRCRCGRSGACAPPPPSPRSTDSRCGRPRSRAPESRSPPGRCTGSAGRSPRGAAVRCARPG